MKKKGLNPYHLKSRTEDIMALEVMGYAIEQKSAYHFRINGCIDLYPVSFKFHDLRKNEWGIYPGKKVIDFICEKIKI